MPCSRTRSPVSRAGARPGARLHLLGARVHRASPQTTPIARPLCRRGARDRPELGDARATSGVLTILCESFAPKESTHVRSSHAEEALDLRRTLSDPLLRRGLVYNFGGSPSLEPEYAREIRERFRRHTLARSRRRTISAMALACSVPGLRRLCACCREPAISSNSTTTDAARVPCALVDTQRRPVTRERGADPRVLPSCPTALGDVEYAAPVTRLGSMPVRARFARGRAPRGAPRRGLHAAYEQILADLQDVVASIGPWVGLRSLRRREIHESERMQRGHPLPSFEGKRRPLQTTTRGGGASTLPIGWAETQLRRREHRRQQMPRR